MNEALEKAREAQKAMGKVSPETNPIAKWQASDKKSRVLAMKAFCATCMGCEPDYIEPGFRTAIKNCTAPTCPLFTFRPYQDKN